MPYTIFVGYCGDLGKSIACDILNPLKSEFDVFLVADCVPDSVEFYSSQEDIFQYVEGTCDAAIMVTTHKTFYSKKFKDEVQFCTYTLRIPVVAFIMKRSPVLRTLKLQTWVKFDNGYHLQKCDELIQRTRALIDARERNLRGL